MNNKIDTNPQNVQFITIVFRAFAGFGGGMIGSILLFLIFFLVSNISGLDIIQASTGKSEHPIFIFVIMTIAIVGIITASTMSAMFFSFAESQRYFRLRSSLVQILIVNIIIFISMVPIYTLTHFLQDVPAEGEEGVNVFAIVFACHTIISSFSSNIILEIMADWKHSILEIYSTIVSVIISILLSGILFQLNHTIVIFALMPIFWMITGVFCGIFRMIYYLIYSNYGVDILSVDAKYSYDYNQDNGKIKKSQKEEIDEIFDEEE